MTKAEAIELSDSLAHAAQIAWRWLRDDESPWDRYVTLRMVDRLSRSSEQAREFAETLKQ